MALSTLVFADPFFTDMDRAMNRFMRNSELVSGSRSSSPAAAPAAAASNGLPALAAAMDIVETPTAYELTADAPGMSPEDVKVELHEGVLTVSGERKVCHNPASKQEGGGSANKVWRSERRAFAFSRSFTLPDNADADGIRASMDKGVLTVAVPKKDPPAKPEPKRIAVTAAS